MAKCSPFNKNYMSKIGKDCNKSNKLNVFRKGGGNPWPLHCPSASPSKYDAQPFNYSYRKEKVIYKKSKAKEYKNIII
jgi:hypothetical protein